MLSGKKAVYFLCNDEGRQGLVSRAVLDILKGKNFTVPAGFDFAGREVIKHTDERGNEYYFAPTAVPVCLDYPKYLPEMNARFAAFDLAGMVTWHEGGSAPPKVLTVHSIGDVAAGVYGPAEPTYTRNLLLALERGRAAFGLDGFEVVTEATHWSGTLSPGCTPDLILQFPVPMVDIEVGSVPGSWANGAACQALADALTQAFDGDGKKLRNLLCLGGIHFEPAFFQAAFTEWAGETGDEALGVSHVLANQWLVAGEYESERGLAFARAAAEAVRGGIAAVAVHDKAKGCYKDLARALGAKYGVPVLKHQRLRNPADIQW